MRNEKVRFRASVGLTEVAHPVPPSMAESHGAYAQTLNAAARIEKLPPPPCVGNIANPTDKLASPGTDAFLFCVMKSVDAETGKSAKLAL